MITDTVGMKLRTITKQAQQILLLLAETCGSVFR